MRIDEIDGLRAIAALSVLAVHYFSWIRHSGAQYGWLGVDLFFVISGYLITSVLLELKSQHAAYFTTFYGRRILRIFPAYFLVLGVCFAISIATHHPGTRALWAKYVFYYASLLFSMNSGYDLNPVADAGLFVFWSLSVEEIFYMVWAPVVRFMERPAFRVFLGCIVIGAPLLRWSLRSYGGLETYTIYCRMDGLAFGSWVALIATAREDGSGSQQRRERIANKTCVVLGLLSLAYFGVAGSSDQSWRVTLFGISLSDMFFASLLYYVVRNAGTGVPLARLLRFRGLRSIGIVSYSLYLVHSPLLIVAEDLCVGLHSGPRVNTLITRLFATALSLGAAYAMWYIVEAPALRLKHRLFPATGERRADLDAGTYSETY